MEMDAKNAVLYQICIELHRHKKILSLPYHYIFLNERAIKATPTFLVGWDGEEGERCTCALLCFQISALLVGSTGCFKIN